MQIETRSKGFPLTEGLRQHIRQRLRFAFNRIAARVKRVVVHLSDVNGPRGGPDKRCQLRVQLERQPEVVIEDTRDDLYAAVDQASERAAQSVTRRLAKQRRYRREGASG
ncbi:HPF/RaiA family ribosome-associated protein [Sinimarinibacterium thermocellulolyticum]|uniref:HPF/RaiA family ribosome-associated protein n=1 Tax=Sinimarinibacterium thermocellulolyticum TaxID=3170016 RepID=A0ABV2A8W2_9GAMM